MLPRFCKICSQVLDNNVVNLRRFSAKYVKDTSRRYNNEEDAENNEEYNNNEEFLAEEQTTPKPKKDKTLIIKCKRPSFNFYKGDTYSKFQPIPLASRSWNHRDSRGDYFTIYPEEEDIEEKIDRSLSFKNINLDQGLLDNMEYYNIVHPTPIQKLGIPKILDGQNVILTAETGSGKTYAFLLPLIQQILKWKTMKERSPNTPLGLIITPSRELTLQITKEAKKLTKDLDIKISKFIGGKTKKMMYNPPVAEVDLVITTLGVMSKLVTNQIYKMHEIRHVVIDEADTLFDETFNDHMKHFLRKIPIGASRDSSKTYPSTAQLTLNSTTIPQYLSETLDEIVDVGSLLPVATGNEHKIKVPQKFLRVGSSQKPMELLKLVKAKAKNKIPIIIFTNRASTCDFTSIFLKQFNVNTINLHGNMPRSHRMGRFMSFQNGECTVLTTTDAGARGLDTTIAKDVINFDFPLITAEYIHRCGRTGRIGSPKDCRVVNLISRPLEIILTRKIEFAYRKNKPIPMVDLIHQNENDEANFLTTTVTDDDNEEEDLKDDILKDIKMDFPNRMPQ